MSDCVNSIHFPFLLERLKICLNIHLCVCVYFHQQIIRTCTGMWMWDFSSVNPDTEEDFICDWIEISMLYMIFQKNQFLGFSFFYHINSILIYVYQFETLLIRIAIDHNGFYFFNIYFFKNDLLIKLVAVLYFLGF